MNRDKLEYKYLISFIGIWISFVALCVYYMILNATWIGGDEAIVCNAIGWSQPINQGTPEFYSLGRFFPLSYTLYNLLPLLFEGQISPTIIYIYHACFFVIYLIGFVLISFLICKNTKSIFPYVIALLMTVLLVGRCYNLYNTCFTGMWIVISLMPVFLYSLCKFHEKSNMFYGLVALLVITYLTYCYETMFTISLTLGFCAFLFQRKFLSTKEKLFYGGLMLNAIIFLALYIFWIIPQKTQFYDGGHGSNVSLLVNAFNILYAQKIMWIVIMLLTMRVIDVLRNKKQLNIFDNLLFASCAYFLGGIVLGLNFTYYYNIAILCAIPSILYFSIHYVKPKWTILLFICIAVFYGRKIPNEIVSNQKSRLLAMNNFSKITEIAKSDSIYFYSPVNSELNDYDLELRRWHRNCTNVILSWHLKNNDYTINTFSEFDETKKGLWYMYYKDERAFLEHAISNVDIKKCDIKYNQLIFYHY